MRPAVSDTAKTDLPPAGPQMKPYIAAIHAYVPGKSTAADGRKLVKLSANENPLGTSPATLAALAQPSTPRDYPDPDSKALRAKIGEMHGLDPALVVCGTGSDELLNLAAQAFAGPGDEVLFSRFSFSVYDIAARRCGATPVEAPDTDYASDVDTLLAHVSDKTRVVFLANPNNPTGTYMPRAELARLHAGLPADVLLVVDQAYGEYVAPEDEDGALDLAKAHGNVLVTRTFSKIYGMAGERVGWGFAAPAIISALNRIRGPFNVTLSAQRAGMAALEDQDFVRSSREHNASERARFVAAIEALGNHGLRAVPSEANFVLVLFEGDVSAEAAMDAIAQAGFAVRHLPGQGLPQALRITIGTAQQMDAIAASLRALAGENA